MDILTFINSKDIATHLKHIGYQFTTLQAAWLVYQSRKATLKEKIEAWREIIATMPDSSVEKRNNCIPMKSVHEFLREYIFLQEKLIREFQTPTTAAIYRLELRYENDDGFGEWEDFYSTYDKCLMAAKNEADDGLDIAMYRIKKTWIDQKNKAITAYYDRDLSLQEISSSFLSGRESDLQGESFDGMWFDLPTPFKKGDVLIDVENPHLGCCSGPFVVTEINIDPKKHKEIYERLAATGDTTDMTAHGFFQTDDGIIYFECMNQYMNLEYYRGDLTGKRRILKAMSNFQKGNISEELLLCAYHQILMEEHSKDIMPNWYTDEGLELAGLK